MTKGFYGGSKKSLDHDYERIFFSRSGRHTSWPRDWSSDVCSSDLDATDLPMRDRVRVDASFSAARGEGRVDPPPVAHRQIRRVALLEAQAAEGEEQAHEEEVPQGADRKSVV